MMLNKSGSYERSVGGTLDWWLIGCYFILVLFGVLNIYASIQNTEPSSIFALDTRSGKQIMWIGISVLVALALIFFFPPRLFDVISPFLYGLILCLLVLVIFIGGSVKGSHSWFTLGPVSFQPAEVSKITTSLFLATIVSRFGLEKRGFIMAVLIILVPMMIIVLEHETGSALVYVGFIFMLYREGLSGWVVLLMMLCIVLFIITLTSSSFWAILLLLAIVSLSDSVQNRQVKWWIPFAAAIICANCFIPAPYNLWAILAEASIYACYSFWRAFRGHYQGFRWATLATLLLGTALVLLSRFFFDNVLKDYQRSRIEVLLNIKEDFSGAGYNVRQSLIAIGSGGFFGKGYLKGTQTAYGFVPEQSTDFIFCTVGEEWGFAGCFFLLAVYGFMLYRIIRDSERSREAFIRIYGYCLAGCMFMHLIINLGMTLGLMPVIGIPLPLMSYGGSSVLSFTVMLFIFISLYRNERKYF